MRDNVTFPTRQLEVARRAGRELVTVLHQMSSGNEAITVASALPEWRSYGARAAVGKGTT
jgi:hypothetical protein